MKENENKMKENEKCETMKNLIMEMLETELCCVFYYNNDLVATIFQEMLEVAYIDISLYLGSDNEYIMHILDRNNNYTISMIHFHRIG